MFTGVVCVCIVMLLWSSNRIRLIAAGLKCFGGKYGKWRCIVAHIGHGQCAKSMFIHLCQYLRSAKQKFAFGASKNVRHNGHVSPWWMESLLNFVSRNTWGTRLHNNYLINVYFYRRHSYKPRFLLTLEIVYKSTIPQQ